MIPSAVLLDLMVKPTLDDLGHSALPGAPVLDTPTRRPLLARTVTAARRLTPAHADQRPAPAVVAPSAPRA